MKNTLIILLFLLSNTIGATTYYISTSGSDSKTGTISSPWATLAYAVSHATSGDIIHINAGSYTISSQISVPAGISTSGSDSKTGTISSPWATLAYAVSHATSGDIIHINAGSYTISSQISVPAGISIEGDGNTTVLN